MQRVTEVASRLALTKPAATIITVAGTNGKGSCVGVMEAILHSQDISIGAFTSPHILNFNERIRINATNAGDEEICAAFAAIERARDTISLTYFEFATLAAFYIFHNHSVDYWLLEVGLGGRLDAVNLLDADLVVITSIDLDHQRWLGDTREAIAWEKAGVLRKNIPCVVAEPAPPESLVNVIESLQCDSYKYEDEFSLNPDGKLIFSNCYHDNQCAIDGVVPKLPRHSVAAACQALALLDKLPHSDSLKMLINSLSLAGRFQIEVWGEQVLILDVAHNPAATQLLAEKLSTLRSENETCFVTAVIGMMQDKAIEESLQPLAKRVNHWLVANLPGERAASKEKIADALLAIKVPPSAIQRVESVEAALDDLTNKKNKTQLGGVGISNIIVIAGSFLTVARGLDYIEKGKNAVEASR